MSLISDALSTALDRFRRHGLIIVGFALVLVSLNVAFRIVSSLAGSFGIAASVAVFVAGFALTIYLSYVALRFSYRALATPVFDLSADAWGYLRLVFVQLVLLCISFVYLLVPVLLALSRLEDVVDYRYESEVSALLEPLATPLGTSLALLLGLVSVYLAIRFSMASFRVVVRGDGPLAALNRSWTMTARAFWSVAGYWLIPFGVLLVLMAIVGVLSLPFLGLGLVGQLLLALFGIVFYVCYALIIDPSLAIGKAKLFELLDSA